MPGCARPPALRRPTMFRAPTSISRRRSPQGISGCWSAERPRRPLPLRRAFPLDGTCSRRSGGLSNGALHSSKARGAAAALSPRSFCRSWPVRHAVVLDRSVVKSCPHCVDQRAQGSIGGGRHELAAMGADIRASDRGTVRKHRLSRVPSTRYTRAVPSSQAVATRGIVRAEDGRADRAAVAAHQRGSGRIVELPDPEDTLSIAARDAPAVTADARKNAQERTTRAIRTPPRDGCFPRVCPQSFQ